MSARFAVGIDLGTTHSAMALCELEADPARVRVLDVPQLVARGSVEARPLLPSFVYFAHESDGALNLPWGTRSEVVGEFARSRAVEAPGRVISSAKSWLCHPSVDRRAGILPPNAAPEIEKISPVEAAFRVLDHLSESFRSASGSELALGEQEIVLTVPASFDAAARDLTAEAAAAAGFEHVTLLEEPQAALYAWIEAAGERWREHLGPGDVVLVVDIGGGTSDFSAIAVLERDGNLELHRVAVGDHILLGGDNMDLLLAELVRQRLLAEGHELDAWQLASLTHGARAAKERLLAAAPPESVPVVIPSRGAKLLGGSLRSELLRSDVERVIVEGFFPAVAAGARPATRARSGLTQLGLPYAADAAVTRHLSAFLARQAAALPPELAKATPSAPATAPASSEVTLLRPTRVLFNGGVLKAPAIRERLLAVLNGWFGLDGAGAIRVLPGEDPDLAVARGAAYYGLVRRGRGLRIRGGSARAYYVGMDSPMPAIPGLEPPIQALCVAPFGMEEGSSVELTGHELGLVVGEPVTFRFFGSSVRRSDAAGALLERWKSDELSELSPIALTLAADQRREGDVVPVTLSASITPIGPLLLVAVPKAPLAPGERWKIELGVRDTSG